MAVLLVSAEGFLAPAAFAQETCPARIQGNSLNCTTAAITVANVTVVPGQNTTCLAGTQIPLNLEVNFESNKNSDVFDVSVWFAQDGGAIDDPAGAQNCISKPIDPGIFGDPPDETVQVTTVPPEADGDACPDTISGTKGVFFTDPFDEVLVDCNASLGGAPLEALVAWKSSGGGATCSAENLTDLASFQTSQCQLNTTQVLALDVVGELTIVKSSEIAEATFDFTTSGGWADDCLSECTEITDFTLDPDGVDTQVLRASLGDTIVVTEDDTTDLQGISCTITGTDTPALTPTVNAGEVSLTLDGTEPFVTCTYTNNTDTPVSRTVTVSKTYSDSNTNAVSVSLACGATGTVLNSPQTATPGDPGDPAVFNVVPTSESDPVCTATEQVPSGYTADQSDCANLQVVEAGVSCSITNTLNADTITVIKSFTDENTSSVSVDLSCSNQNIVIDDTPLDTAGGQDNSVEFSLSGFDEGDTCTATETVPEGYVADESDCASVAPGESCTIVNTPVIESTLARFKVTKDFVPDNAMPVEVSIVCDTGLPLQQSKVIDESSSVNFVVTEFLPGEMDCTITEEEISGYTTDYDPGDLDGEAASLGSDGGCHFLEVEGGQFTCDITNTAEDATFVVNKVWDVVGNGGAGLDKDAEVTITCSQDFVTSSPAADSSSGTGPFSNTYEIDDDATITVTLDSSAGTVNCNATETSLPDYAEESGNTCTARDIAPGATSSCTITNTVFFEGIPTLNQYGMALLALLMLGVGVIGIRRFV